MADIKIPEKIAAHSKLHWPAKGLGSVIFKELDFGATGEGFAFDSLQKNLNLTESELRDAFAQLVDADLIELTGMVSLESAGHASAKIIIKIVLTEAVQGKLPMSGAHTPIPAPTLTDDQKHDQNRRKGWDEIDIDGVRYRADVTPIHQGGDSDGYLYTKLVVKCYTIGAPIDDTATPVDDPQRFENPSDAWAFFDAWIEPLLPVAEESEDDTDAEPAPEAETFPPVYDWACDQPVGDDNGIHLNPGSFQALQEDIYGDRMGDDDVRAERESGRMEMNGRLFISDPDGAVWPGIAEIVEESAARTDTESETDFPVQLENGGWVRVTATPAGKTKIDLVFDFGKQVVSERIKLSEFEADRKGVALRLAQAAWFVAYPEAG